MNAKIMAMMMVGVMMFSGLAITMGNEDSTLDAVVGDGGAYSYTLTYHADQMANTAAQELQLTVADMTPISHASGTTTLSSVANEGSWGFNTTTGIGPFNSFYAAFDRTNGNSFVAILNPYDLTETIAGVDISASMSDYNIMWVIPTVYWSVNQNGDLTLTNNSNSGGVAYAHTINGNVYNYLAIGVYEGSIVDSLLTSTTGNSPSVQKRSLWGSSYVAYTMDESLGDGALSGYLRYYQQMLYRYCSLCVMEGWDSQAIVGNGVTGTYTQSVTGLTDTLGPYAGNPGPIGSNGAGAETYAIDSVKCFIENAWGNASEFINGLAVTSTEFIIYPNISNSDSPTTVSITVPGGYATGISTDPSTWGVPTDATGGAYNIGTTDSSVAKATNNNVAFGGGNGPADASSLAPGINYFQLNVSNNATNTQRLMLAFDNLNSIVTASFAANENSYGTVSTASISGLPSGTVAVVSNNTITIGNDVITATPATSDAQYTYAFSKWQANGVDVSGSYTISADTTFTAVFTRSVNDYTVTATASSYGSVSPASVTQPYGSAISASGNVLTIGSQTITATPDAADAQYTYAFTGWSTFPSTLTENTSVTANFDRTVNTYTITWSISGSTTSETLSYGEMPSHEDPVPPEGYLFAGWNPEIATVTGDQTYTAVFEEIVYITVTFDPNGGQLEGSATKSVGIGLTYGELPTPKKDNNKFLGWYTDPEEGTLVTANTVVTVDADQTLYAHWELTGFAAMLKPLLFLFPLILLAFLAIALVRTFA